MLVTVEEAALRLGVNADTIRRRLRSGALSGYKTQRSEGGIAWLVDLPEGAPNDAIQEPSSSAHSGSPSVYAENQGEPIQALLESIRVLQRQLDEKDRELQARRAEMADLIGVVRHYQEKALPAPSESKPWWRRLFSRGS